MDKSKKERLEAAGWQAVSVKELLNLSDEEESYVELKLQLSDALKRRRKRLRWSQETLASRIRSSQSRIAKMEAADPTVSIDLLIRGLLATGISRSRIAASLGVLESEGINDTVS